MRLETEDGRPETGDGRPETEALQHWEGWTGAGGKTVCKSKGHGAKS
jgi:hypothetical protein